MRKYGYIARESRRFSGGHGRNADQISLLRKAILGLGLLGVAAFMTVGFTMAYLSDTAVDQNRFAVGDVSVRLDEGGFDPNGPGGKGYALDGEIPKAPRVINDGFHDAYVRVVVAIPAFTDATGNRQPVFIPYVGADKYAYNSGWEVYGPDAAWEEPSPSTGTPIADLEDYFAKPTADVTGSDAYVLVFYYKNKLPGTHASGVHETAPIFDGVAVHPDFSNEHLLSMSGAPLSTILVYAEAIQTNYAGYVDDTPTAKEAFWYAFDSKGLPSP
jgi:hypothetical protein